MTCLIVDDERLARAELKRMLQKHSSLQLLGEAKDASEAKVLIEDLKPDFILLDIQMPGQSGFELLESLAYCPEVIFISAYDQYAIKAFELNALDYLLKPTSEDRLSKSLDRVRLALAHKKTEGQNYTNHFFFNEGKQLGFITTEQIEYILSIGNYAQIHSDDKRGLIKSSLNMMEPQLNPKNFFRINRSQIVNIQKIDKVWQKDKVLILRLQSGIELSVSERKSVEFKRKFKFN